MVGRKIIHRDQPSFTNRFRREAERQAGLWQGYAGTRTPNAGWEISVQTSRFTRAPVVAAGIILVAIVALTGYGTPPPVHSNDLSPGSAMVLAGLATSILLGLPLGFLYGQCPRLMRHFELEKVEIRPDGLTLNRGGRRESFFGRDEILTIGIEVLPNEPEEFRYGLIGIIGTRELALLRGLDKATGQRVGHDIEIARRTLWQDAR